MKTTIDIPDSLMREVKRRTAIENTSFKALVEEGLRKVLEERKRSAQFKLRQASFKGAGLRPEAQGLSWEQIRDLSYKGRGA